MSSRRAADNVEEKRGAPAREAERVVAFVGVARGAVGARVLLDARALLFRAATCSTICAAQHLRRALPRVLQHNTNCTHHSHSFSALLFTHFRLLNGEPDYPPPLFDWHMLVSEKNEANKPMR